jgi:hypothetical protein
MIIRQEQLDALGQQAQQQGDSLVTPCPVVLRDELTEQEAQQLFEELQAQDHIPFDYPVDCCYSRANEMSRIMESKGIASRKHWLMADIEGRLGKGKCFLTPLKAGQPVKFFNVETGQCEAVEWLYHVAPMVKVRKPDGSIADMILDPSVADQPVSPDEWRKIQGDLIACQEDSTDGPAQGETPEDTAAQLEEHCQTRDQAREAERTCQSAH